MKTRSGAAPVELIRQDFKALDAQVTLRTTWPNEEIILLQSVHGHAHEGHGVFRGRAFPNTTLDDVTRALRLDPERIRRERQDLIDGIVRYVDRTLGGDPPARLLDEDGDPLAGISTLRFLTVDAADVLRGIYLGGLRDISELRGEVEKAYGIRIGGGRLYHVDFDRADAMGLSGDALARGAWEDDIARFEEEGLIVDAARANEPGVAYQYIRHRPGPGASDDAAIVGAGMLWGLGVAVGVFLADVMDTIDKYVPAYSDQDRVLAERIEAGFDDLKFGPAEARTLTFLSAGSDDPDVETPDSSLRHMLAVDRMKDLCLIEAHLLAVQGLPVPRLRMSRGRLSTTEFYAYLRARADALPSP